MACDQCHMCYFEDVPLEVTNMRASLRTRSYVGLDLGYNTMENLECLLRCESFDRLADLNDGYESAYNALSVLFWMNAGCFDHPGNTYWQYMITHGFGSLVTDDEASALLSTHSDQIGALIDMEFNIVRHAEAPIQSLAEQQPAILARFKSAFLPEVERVFLSSFYGDFPGEDGGNLELPQHE